MTHYRTPDLPKNPLDIYKIISTEGDVEKLKHCVDSQKIDITNHDPELADSFQLAIKKNFIEMVSYLLSHGYSPNYTHSKYGSPLEIAASSGLKDMVRLLLNFGADVNIVSKNGYNALAHTIWNSTATSLQIAELLINQGIDINLSNELGRTPLHSAFIEGNNKLADILIENGADTNAKDKYGKCPSEYLR